jgi:hypothetical protein
MRFLLDNDVFFAAIYAGHVNHAAARKWLDAAKPEGWGIAVETYLAAIRLLMNPAIMHSHAFTAAKAIQAVDLELAGKHPGRVLCATTKPERAILAKAQGHRQVMDFWLVQLAREAGCKLVTNDGGTLNHWPEDTLRPLRA